MSALLSVSIGASFARPARADDGPGEAAEKYARELFEKADTAMRNTPPDYEAACEGFRKAYEVAHGLGALKKQAVCEEARGKLATALALWNQAIALPQAEDRKAEAQKQIILLEGKVGRLLVEAPPSGARLSAMVDGAPWPVGDAKAIDAGAHKVVFDGTDREGRPLNQTVDVTVTNGATAKASASETASASMPIPTPLPLPPDRGAPLRVAGFVVGGLGAAGLIAFGVTGGLVLSTGSDLRDACTNHDTEPYSGCNADASDIASKGTALNIANGVSLGVGIVGVGVAIPLLVLGYKNTSSPSALVVPWVDQHTVGIVAGGGF